MMDDTMEAYQGDNTAETVYFVLNGDDDPVQEAELNDVLYANGPFPVNDQGSNPEPTEPWDGVAR